MEITLVMFKADGTRREFPLVKDRIKIGRTHRCDLRVPLASVSRDHCEILIQNRDVKIRDLASSNGTFHNNIRIQEAPLAPGDEISIGPVIFTVVIDGRPAQISPIPTILKRDVENDIALCRTAHPTPITTVTLPQPREASEPEPVPEESYSPTTDMDNPDQIAGKLFEEEPDDQDQDDYRDPDDSRFESDRSGMRSPQPV